MVINLDIEPYKLSCRLPYSFTISGINGKSVEVQIIINRIVIYETTLAAKNSAEASFYDLRSLVHQYMEAAMLTTALLNVKARDNNSTTDMNDPVEVLFAKIDAPCDDDDTFLASSFLTTRTFYTLPRTESGILYFVFTPQEKATPRLSCVFAQGSGARSYAFELDRIENDTQYMKVYSMRISHNDIRTKAGDRAHTVFEWLLSVTITLGTRTFSIFFTDEEPARIFYFKNAYNIEEKAFIFGTAKMKSVFTNKQASVGGVTSFYDRSKEVTWEMETSTLVQEEAVWLNQLFDSPSVYMDVSTTQREYVLFDGITSEISDADNEVIRLKFSYRYESNNEYSPEHPDNVRIFTKEYTQQFT